MPLVELTKSVYRCRNLVGGEWRAPHGPHDVVGVHENERDVTSPYTGQLIGRVPMSNAMHVAQAVEGAKRASDGWRNTPIKERTQRMFAYRELLLKCLDELAHTAASEAGKTVAEARAGVLKGVEVVEFALSIQNLDLGGNLEVSRGVTCEYRREPLGVVAGITPFNFPAMVPMWMFPIAVVLGNCFVWKPSEKVPLTACRLGELMLEAGFTNGIFSIVHGGKDAVEAILDHPDVKAVAFVGSSPVAKFVYERASRSGKRALALGGAKNHLIVVPDAEIELTAQSVLDSFTGCAGQRCMAGSVMVAVGDVEPIVARLREKAAAIEVGAQMGAIIDQASLSRITDAIASAEKRGAKVVVDGRGKQPRDAEYKSGTWIGPTILDNVKPDSPAAQVEIFGPVLSIVRVPTLGDAIALEGQSTYGNAASIFTTNGGVAEYVANRVHAGMIGVNVGVPVPREPFSFGGTHESKFGHGDITGHGGIEFWSSLKKITRKWSTQSDSNWMS